MKIEAIKNKLFRFALSMLNNEADAQDVVQEVVIKLWKQRDKMDQIQNLEAWTMRLTRNLSIDKLRSKHRRYEPIENAASLATKTVGPDRQTELNDSINKLKAWIVNLPEKQRLVFQLRDIEGLSYKEIEDILEMPVSQVKINLFRARKQVRNYLLKSKLYG